MIKWTIKILLISGILVLWACSKKDPVNTNSAANQRVPDQEMWNFSVQVTNKGLLEAHLKSGHMVFFDDKNEPQSILNQGVLVDFYDKDGKLASTLTADSGLFNEKSRDVKAFRNVVVESDSGVVLHTEAIQYDQQREKIYTNLDVMITTTQGDSFWGKGFESDPQMKNWEILSLHGIAHKGVDLSQDLSKKGKKGNADTDSVAADTLEMQPEAVLPDSGQTGNENQE